MQQGGERILRFIKYRDEAMFQAVLAAEETDVQVHLQAAREAARNGLAQFGMAGDGPEPANPFDVDLYGADGKQWLADSCYELYLTWADALTPVPSTPAAERQFKSAKRFSSSSERSSSA